MPNLELFSYIILHYLKHIMKIILNSRFIVDREIAQRHSSVALLFQFQYRIIAQNEEPVLTC